MNSQPTSLDELMQHAPWAHRLARRLVHDAATADDLVQDAWLAATRHAPTIAVAPRAWLTGVVRQAAAQWQRTRVRRERREAHRAEPEGASLDPAVLVQRHESQQLLSRAVLDLPEPLRSTITLRYFDDLSSAEIGRRLGVPSATIRWRLAKGLEMLRTSLDQRHGGDRRAWCIVLIPLAGRPLLMASLKASLLQAAHGGLIVKPTTKITALSVIVLLAATVAWRFGWPVDPVTPPPDQSPRDLVVRGANDAAPPGTIATGRAAVRPVPFRPAEDPAAAPAPPDQVATAGVHISGRVVDRDGRPVVGARIIETHFPSIVSLTSAADGRFEFHLRDAETISRLGLDGQGQLAQFAVTAAGFALLPASAHVKAGVATDLGDLVLAPGGSVHGRVLLADGTPAARAVVNPIGVDAGSGPRTIMPLIDIQDPDVVSTIVRRGLTAAVVSHVLEGAGASESEARAAAALSTVPADLEMPTTIAATRSARDGTFVLDGVPLGLTRIQARLPGQHDGISALVDVREGPPGPAIDVTLASRDEIQRRLEISVVDAAGAPVSHVLLTARFQSTDGRKETVTDQLRSDGRVVLVTAAEGTFDLEAQTEDPALGSTRVTGVATGSPPVKITLAPAATVPIRALDLAGKPIAGAAARAMRVGAPSGSRWNADLLATAETPDGAGSLLQLKIPVVPFEVEVEAPDWTTVRLGPFERATLPSEITAMLAPLPGATGRITRDGAGVGNVEVLAHAVHGPEATVFLNGFLSWVGHPHVATAQSAADGSYRLALRTPGTFVIEARSDGAPSVFSAPFIYDPRTGRREDLALIVGGVIQGMVRIGGGHSPAGIIVGVSQGGPRVQSHTVSADGTFRFEHLTPGGWMVRVLQNEASDAQTNMITCQRPAPPLAFDCTVRDGQVTRYDLDLGAGPGSCIVEGVIPLSLRRSDLRWTAELVVDLDPLGFRTQSFPGTVDDGGSFRVAMDRPGAAALVLTAHAANGWATRVRTQMDVPTGTTKWHRTFTFGTLAGSFPALAAARTVAHRASLGGADRIETAVPIDEHGVIAPVRVPSGSGELRPRSADADSAPVAHCDVPANDAPPPGGDRDR